MTDRDPEPGAHLEEEPQEERGAPGSRDTGSDEPAGGPVDRPAGTSTPMTTRPSTRRSRPRATHRRFSPAAGSPSQERRSARPPPATTGSHVRNPPDHEETIMTEQPDGGTRDIADDGTQENAEAGTDGGRSSRGPALSVGGEQEPGGEMPPYDGRQASGQVDDDGSDYRDGARVGGATGPVVSSQGSASPTRKTLSVARPVHPAMSSRLPSSRPPPTARTRETIRASDRPTSRARSAARTTEADPRACWSHRGLTRAGRCCSCATRTRRTGRATAVRTTPRRSSATAGPARSTRASSSWRGVRRRLAVPGADRRRHRHRGPARSPRGRGVLGRASALLDRVGAATHRQLHGGAVPRHAPVGSSAALAEGVVAGGVPHHSFHVFCIYPWVGLLGDDRRGAHALTVLDRCRIRWGQVRAVDRRTRWSSSRGRCCTTAGRLFLGEPERETAECSVDGSDAGVTCSAGDWVSLHWEWVCDRLTDAAGRRRCAATRCTTSTSSTTASITPGALHRARLISVG